MSYESGRQALLEESKLLASLLQATDSYAASLSKDASLAAFIANDWAGSFKKLQKLNAEIAAKSDEDFEKTFNGEKELLRQFLNVCKDHGFAKSWTELFQRDLEIAEQMLKR
jgi:hypothetical protein